MEDGPYRTPLVLIASHQEWATRSLDSILSQDGYAVRRAYTGDQAVERALREQPDAIFVDTVLPDAEGEDLCRRLREAGAAPPGTPLFLLASDILSRDRRLRALAAGAWDVLGFPLDGEELVLRLRRYVAAKLFADQALQQAMVDSETGLYNWRGLARRTREIGGWANRYHRSLTCVVLALPDDLEQEGRPIADSDLLHRLGDQLRQQIRSSDVAGRLGRGDFVVVAPETGPVGAAVLTRRLAEALNDTLRTAGAARTVRLRPGAYSAEDFHASGLDPLQIVLHASLRARENGHDGESDLN